MHCFLDVSFWTEQKLKDFFAPLNNQLFRMIKRRFEWH